LKRIGKEVDMTAAEVSASLKRIPQRGPLVTHVRDRRQIPNIAKVSEPQRLRSGRLNGVKRLAVSYRAKQSESGVRTHGWSGSAAATDEEAIARILDAAPAEGTTSRAVFGNLHSTGVKAAADQDTLACS
jgi:hypothetical protein